MDRPGGAILKTEGPEKRRTPVTDPFIGEGVRRGGSRIRISLLARTAQEIAILNPNSG
ncbi:hypothetical protein ACLOJK_037455 [Asimina triloba]